MNALSAIYHHSCAQVAHHCQKVKKGYSNLTYKIENIPHPQRNRVFAAAFAVTAVATAIFRLAIKATIPSVAVGATAGLAYFAYQCYQFSDSKWSSPDFVSSLPVAQPVSVPAASQKSRSYSSRFEFVAKARTFAEALVTKCQALWNKKDKEAAPSA